jgi:hypothetical protein
MLTFDQQHEGARESLDFGFAQGFMLSERGKKALRDCEIMNELESVLKSLHLHAISE